MKKYSIPVCVVILIISMCFCAFSQTPTTQVVLREGIWPYEFTERDKSLLRDFGLNVGSNAMMYQFNAPEEAIEMLVRVYQVENNRWQMRDKFGISIGEEREPVDRLSGILSIHRPDQHKMIVRIHNAGLAEFPVTLEELEGLEGLSFGYDYLDISQQIETGKEIMILQLGFNDDGRLSMQNYNPYTRSWADVKTEPVYDEAYTAEERNLLDVVVTVTFNETDEKIRENYKVIE